MTEHPIFSPDQYNAAISSGLSYQQMLGNIDARAEQLGRLIVKSMQGSPLFSIAELAAEAAALKTYRAALMNFLLDPIVSPLNTKRAA